MQSSHLFPFFLSSLALSLQTCLALLPTSASGLGHHISHKRHFMQPYHESPRSLNIADFPLTVMPTSSRVSSPIVMKLYPAGKPSHLQANLPLRFGRTSEVLPQREQQAPSKSSLNLPQRFGRSDACSKCRRSGTPPSATLPQRFGRRNMQGTMGRLPIHTLFSILATASKSLEEKIRTSDENSSEWMGVSAERQDRTFTDF